jgi:hypothetical protein
MLVVVFTEDGEKRVTLSKFKEFERACCGENVRMDKSQRGLKIIGYSCGTDPYETMIKKWALAKLIHETFSLETDVH